MNFLEGGLFHCFPRSNAIVIEKYEFDFEVKYDGVITTPIDEPEFLSKIIRSVPITRDAIDNFSELFGAAILEILYPS